MTLPVDWLPSPSYCDAKTSVTYTAFHHACPTTQIRITCKDEATDREMMERRILRIAQSLLTTFFTTSDNDSFATECNVRQLCFCVPTEVTVLRNAYDLETEFFVEMDHYDLNVATIKARATAYTAGDNHDVEYESRYRKGFLHGASQAADAISNTDDMIRVNEWINEKVIPWYESGVIRRHGFTPPPSP